MNQNLMALIESSVIEMDDNCNVVVPETRVQLVIENAKRYG